MITTYQIWFTYFPIAKTRQGTSKQIIIGYIDARSAAEALAEATDIYGSEVRVALSKKGSFVSDD